MSGPNPFLSMDVDDFPNCLGCSKPVYPSERPVAALKGTWHPGCLKCTECRITLNVRSLESYNNKPYCRAHRPQLSGTATKVSDSVSLKTAMNAPKAAKKEQGFDKTDTTTFGKGPQNKPKQHGYVPPVKDAHSAVRKVQGVNKTERMTFAPGKIQNPPVRPMANLSIQDNKPPSPIPRSNPPPVSRPNPPPSFGSTAPSSSNRPTPPTFSPPSSSQPSPSPLGIPPPVRRPDPDSEEEKEEETYQEETYQEETYAEENYEETYAEENYEEGYEEYYEEEYYEGEYYEENYEENYEEAYEEEEYDESDWQ